MLKSTCQSAYSASLLNLKLSNYLFSRLWLDLREFVIIQLILPSLCRFINLNLLQQ
jgi:hypothetical protein